MAKYTGPSCRLCRREGMKLFLKGTKCITPKCPFERRSTLPGQHGKVRPKLSDFGLQLREKQKVKRIYGVGERQFRHYFLKAQKSRGVTGMRLLQYLERRLDNVVFHIGFATSRAQARQIVRHGSIYVNDTKVNIPSYLVKADDIINIKGKEEDLKSIRDNLEMVKDRLRPVWLEADTENLKGKVLRLPEKGDINLPIQEQMIVELYSK